MSAWDDFFMTKPIRPSIMSPTAQIPPTRIIMPLFMVLTMDRYWALPSFQTGVSQPLAHPFDHHRTLQGGPPYLV